MESNTIHKYLLGKANADEREQVVAWANESADNLALLKSLSRTYDAAIWHDGKAADKAQTRKHRLSVWRLSRIAAVFLLGFTLSAALIYYGTASTNTFSTPRGERAQLVLPDGSKVWLSSASSITYPSHFSLFRRNISLQGEAYFQVSHNRHKPFHVKAAGYDVEVLGTEFDVKAYKRDSYEVALFNGKVALTAPDGGRVEMAPGDKIIAGSGKLYRSHELVMDDYSWKDGLISFNNKTFAEIMAMVSHTYDVRIVYRRHSNKSQHYSGKFRINDGLRHVLNVMRLQSPFSYRFSEDEQTVYIE